jgi:hypothetical protein
LLCCLQEKALATYKISIRIQKCRTVLVAGDSSLRSERRATF